MSDTLPAGTQLGPYEIVEPIGSGGMGDVYRGRDARLGRDVAIKVLAPSLASDAQALDRFRQEAQAASALNHPNIITVFDVGLADAGPFLVTELLDGETLREAIDRGRLTSVQAVACAEQVATGLAAAHQKGILHRDIKPDNLFLTSTGTVKILDFGLAKLTDQAPDIERAKQTAPGVLVGTAGYVSPEQIRHQPVDHRTDVFSLGVVLYEALTGRQPFRGDSLGETLSAILTDDPPDVSHVRPGLTAAIDEVVRVCLEKTPERRFDSAADLARTLRAVTLGNHIRAGGLWRPGWRRLAAAAMIALFIVSLVTIVHAIVTLDAMTSPSYRRVTFARATIMSARFGPGGDEIIYDAIVEDQPRELLATVPGTSEARAIGIRDAELLAVSSSGDLALSLKRRLLNGYVSTGTLAVMTEGRAPRDLLEDVHWADWSADGKSLAIVREVAGRTRLEFPINTVLFETSGWISDPRFSPDGRHLAFVDHPVAGDDRGHVMVSNLNGLSRVLSANWLSVLGLAWSASGDELWFTAQDDDARALRAVDLNGHHRLVANGPGRLRLLDISRDGRVLLARDDVRLEAHALAPDESRERNLSWFDWSLARDLSSGGDSLLITEFGEAAGGAPGIYLRPMDGSPAARLGTGSGIALSPDGQRVLAIRNRQLQLLPVGAGEAIPIPNPGISYHPWGGYFPDGRRIAITGAERERARRVYVQALPSGPPTPITPEGFRVASPGAVSPKGDAVVVVGDDERLFLSSVAGGPPRPLSGIAVGEMAAQWQADGRALYVFEQRQIPARVFRVSLTGARELVRTVAPSDLAGAIAIHRLVITPAATSYAYTLERQLSDLYVATGFPQRPLVAKLPLLRTLLFGRREMQPDAQPARAPRD